MIRILTPSLRRRLKRPLGLLVRGDFEETISELSRIINAEKPPMIIAVGDKVSEMIYKRRMEPCIFIVDNRIMRRQIEPLTLEVDKTINVSNPPGTITDEALRAVERSIQDGGRVKILVRGEEDLLALAAILYAPKDSVIVYGQPNEGIVIVKVTDKAKEEVSKIIDEMEIKNGKE